jgi:hypothetical protein
MAALLVLVIAACGGQPSGSSGGDGDGDGGSSTAPAASQDDGNGGGDGDGDGDGDGNGGGGNAGDAESAYQRLTPPNSEEVTKTTSQGVIFAALTTSESTDSLISFYEDAFSDLGLQILTTTESSGATSWFVGTDENATEFGGVITIVPNTEGGGAQVSIQIGATNQ